VIIEDYCGTRCANKVITTLTLFKIKSLPSCCLGNPHSAGCFRPFWNSPRFGRSLTFEYTVASQSVVVSGGIFNRSIDICRVTRRISARIFLLSESFFTVERLPPRGSSSNDSLRPLTNHLKTRALETRAISTLKDRWTLILQNHSGRKVTSVVTLFTRLVYHAHVRRILSILN